MIWKIRIVWWILFIIFDLGLAYLLSWFATYDRFGTMFFYFLVILITPVLFSVWKTIKLWVFFSVYGKERSTRLYVHDFSGAKFPHPEGQFEIDDYLANIIDNKELPVKTRLVAAAIAGQFAYARAMGQFSPIMMMLMSANQAIQRYNPPHSRKISDLSEDFHEIEGR